MTGSGSVAYGLLGALALAHNGDWHGAADALDEAACGSPEDGFACACGLAEVVALVSRGMSGNGPVLVETERVDEGPPDPTEAECASVMASFLAATANRDLTGAWDLWRQLLASDDPVLVAQFMALLFRIAVAAIPEVPA